MKVTHSFAPRFNPGCVPPQTHASRDLNWIHFNTDSLWNQMHCCLVSTQLRGGQISPSENQKKLSRPILLLIRYCMIMPKSQRERKMGVSVPLRELQGTLAVKVKKSIALLFGLKSKNVIKQNILFSPTFILNIKVPDHFDQK